MNDDPYGVIHRPIITEKSVHCAERRRQYAFRVHPDATKPQIRTAIEAIYKHKGTKVVEVRTMNRRGKVRRDRKTGKRGRRPDWKKAVVTLAEGHAIDLY